MTKIYDISPPLSESTAVWPGDVSFTRTINCDLAQGDNIALSAFKSTVHLGAHADAPSHYKLNAPSIDQVDLLPYLGPCVVVTAKGRLIEPKDCEGAIKARAERVLFKTNTYPDPQVFNRDFTAFSAAAIACLGQVKVKLIGIDTPSIDPFESKDLPAHHEILKYGMRNLEGLVLGHVPDGTYELIALPLKLVGFDASPLRAILRKI